MNNISVDKIVQYGWVCPLCGRANSPWTNTCGCVDNSKTDVSATTTNSNPEYIKVEPYDPDFITCVGNK